MCTSTVVTIKEKTGCCSGCRMGWWLWRSHRPSGQTPHEHEEKAETHVLQWQRTEKHERCVYQALWLWRHRTISKKKGWNLETSDVRCEVHVLFH